MARGTIKQRITLDGGKEIEAQLKALGTAGEKAFGQIKSAASKVDVNFGKKFDAFASNLVTTGKRLAYVFAGINTAAIGAYTAIAAVAKSGADAADQAGKAAQKTGLQIDAYGRLAFAAEQNDVAADAFGASMSKLNKLIGEAAGGSKTAKAQFAALGVSLTDAKGRLRPTEQIIQDLAERFSKMPDGAKKSAAAIAVFGKAGAALIPFLNAGKKGLIEMGETAEHLGIVFTESQSEIGDALGDTLDELQKAVTGMKNQIGLLFAPAITATAAQFRDVLLANREAILGFAKSLTATALPVIQDFISALTGNDDAVKNNWVLEWRDAVIDFGKSAKAVFSGVVLPALGLLKKAFDLVAASMKAITGINVNGTMVAIAVAVGQVTGAFRLLRSAIVLAWAAFSANPIVAGAVSLIAGGLLLWATRTDNATAAMEKHETVVNNVRDAYDQAGRKVAAMTESVKLQSLIDTRANLGDLQKSLDTQLNDLRSHLTEQMGLIAKSLDVSAQTGRAPPKIIEQWRPFMAAIDAFVKGGSLATFVAQVRQVGAANPALNNVAKALTDQAQTAEGLFGKLKEESDWIALLSGKMSDADFQARNFTEGQKAVGAAADEAGGKVAGAAKKVEALGKTITVHTSDGGKPIQKTFDLVDGLGKAAEASKDSLDGVTESADKAGEGVKKVTNDISDIIIHVPEELKGQPTIADAMTTGLTDVPAAAKAAADGVIAEVTRVPQAIAGALAGGVAAGGAAGGGGQVGGEQQQQTTGGIAETLTKPFTDARDKIAEALATIPVNVAAMLTAVQTSATEIGAGLAGMLVAPFEDAGTRIADILAKMTTAVQTQFEAMLSAVRSMTAQLQSAVATLESLAARAEAAAARARAASADTGGRANGGPVTRMAGGGLARSGGRVSGPGTSTSDSIRTALSDGEFVIRAAAVRKYGAGLLAMLNGMRLPKDFLKGLRLAGGGMVSSLTDGMRVPVMVPAFAGGGQVAAPSTSGRPINLTIDGQTFQMIAPEDVADRLAKHQGRQGLRKAGKRPSWK
ncbi:hypothetical protein GR217_34440 [Rhizobium leguminosarum]|uniref:Phage tail tape measure protein n=1 Tax=Rhizobium ruizarguesonis TaxID=2081791 RepID=A0AAE4YX99_9HYPH|nr:hypothetical protein [Rhizobium ruizarguesonis]NEI52720.1 hypothetical protein [Rhizobium ruizarguesonis]